MNYFVGALSDFRTEVRFLEDGSERWVNLVPIAFVTRDGVHRLDVGTVSDGASIPRFAWTLIGHPFQGEFARSAFLHDVGCERRTEPARVVHRRFYDGLRAEGVGFFRARAMWLAVSAWHPFWRIDNSKTPD